MLFSLVGVVFGDGREHFVRVSCSHEPKLWIYNPPPPKKKARHSPTTRHTD